MSISSNKMKSQKVQLERLTKNFVEHNLSAAGVSYIFKSRSSRRRLMWLIMVAICMIFMAYMTTNVILEYLSFPKMSIKEDVMHSHLPFPAVTVCPLNPLSQKRSIPSLTKLFELRDVLNGASVKKRNSTLWKKCHSNPLCQWSWFKESCHCIHNPCLSEFCLAENDTHCGCSEIFCFQKKHSSCKYAPLNLNLGNRRSCVCEGESAINISTKSLKTVDNDLEELLNSIERKKAREVIRLIKNSKSFDLVDIEEALMPTTQELYEFSTPLNSILSSCSYEGTHCYQENFTVLFHPNYGVCYMFNFIGREFPGSEVPVNTFSFGSTSGLQLILRVNDKHTLHLLRREIGARIVIHDPHYLPFVSEYGINVKPHDMTAIELSLSKTERLHKPWGDCEQKMHLYSEDEPYTVLGCEKHFGLKAMTSMCNCTMRYLLRGVALTDIQPSFPLCNFSVPAQKECILKSDAVDNKKSCNCRPPCRETKYGYSVTSSELNDDYFRTVKAIHTLHLDEDGNLTYVNNTDSKVLLGVKVYYNSFMVTIDKEVASYSWQTLISNIGGNLGFFMGLTLVTFFEITEFVWDVIRLAMRRFTTPKMKDFSANKIAAVSAPKSQSSEKSVKRLYLRNKIKRKLLQRRNRWI